MSRLMLKPFSILTNTSQVDFCPNDIPQLIIHKNMLIIVKICDFAFFFLWNMYQFFCMNQILIKSPGILKLLYIFVTFIILILLVIKSGIYMRVLQQPNNDFLKWNFESPPLLIVFLRLLQNSLFFHLLVLSLNFFYMLAVLLSSFTCQ